MLKNKCLYCDQHAKTICELLVEKDILNKRIDKLKKKVKYLYSNKLQKRIKSNYLKINI